MNKKCSYIQHPPPHARDVFLFLRFVEENRLTCYHLSWFSICASVCVVWWLFFYELFGVHCAWPVCDDAPKQIESRISAHALGVVGFMDNCGWTLKRLSCDDSEHFGTCLGE